MKADRRKTKKIDLINILIGIIITLVTGYAAYVINEVNKKIDINFGYIMECKQKLEAHLGWHEGRGDVKTKQ
jgi:hypothetical protein